MTEMRVWINRFKETVNRAFGERVWFIGLQGSYSRHEETKESDIDVVVILDKVSAEDIETYAQLLDTLPNREKICGFFGGKNELFHWEPSELFQFYYDTSPLQGSLDALLPLIDDTAVSRAIKIGACGIYHSCIHNMLHKKSERILLQLYKSATFVIYAICFRQTGDHMSMLKYLRQMVEPEERDIIDTYLKLKDGGPVMFREMSETLLYRCKKWIEDA